MGPRACSFCVEMPTSPPSPSSPPSMKRVDAFTSTAAASTRRTHASAFGWVVREDRLAVTGAVARDVRDRLVERLHDLDGQDEVEELAFVVLFARRCRVRRASVAPRRPHEVRPRESPLRGPGRNAAAIASCTRHVSAALQTPGREVLALRTMATALVEVGRRVDEDVAVPVTVEDVGHARVFSHRGDEARPAARDQAVEHVGHLHERGRGVVRRVLDQ